MNEMSSGGPSVTVVNPVKKRLPIMQFESEDQAKAVCREWQERLYLTDWAISVKLVDRVDPTIWLNGQIDISQNYLHARIRITKNCIQDDTVLQCHEAILLHEILHCLYQTIGPEDTTDPKLINYNDLIHRHTERMTRTLIAAKYDLPYNWFDAQSHVLY